MFFALLPCYPPSPSLLCLLLRHDTFPWIWLLALVPAMFAIIVCVLMLRLLRREPDVETGRKRFVQVGKRIQQEAFELERVKSAGIQSPPSPV